MVYSKAIIAVFFALAQFVAAAPVDVEERTYKPAAIVVPITDNGIVYGSGNGGNGGTNIAKPYASSSSSSNVKGWTAGKVVTSSDAYNGISQSANGGDGSAVGTFGSGNHIGRTYVPVIPVISGNGLVVGSGNGGNGGTNIAKPVAVSVADSSVKGVTWGKVKTSSSAGNEILQSADGGSGNAVGSYGSNNHFGRTYKAPVVVPISNNGATIFSGNGGNGGTNVAIPVALSAAGSSSKGKTGGSITLSTAGNIIGQSADGGDGNAVGTYGSNNHFS